MALAVSSVGVFPLGPLFTLMVLASADAASLIGVCTGL
jgi:hypothetical protein